MKFSIPQLMLKAFIKEFISENIIYNDRKTIKPYEIDIYIPEYKLAFEYNGKIWHLDNKNDNIKYKLLIEKEIELIIIIENNRYYDNDIKNQLIKNLKKINNITNKNIQIKDIKSFNFFKAYDEIITEDTLKDICNNYTNYALFKKENYKIYSYLLKRKLLDKYTNHMSSFHPISDKWKNEIDIIQEINKYNNLKDFYKYSQGCYLHIIKNNKKYLLNHFYEKIELEKNKIWNDKISLWKKTILKYKTLKEFRINEPKIYSRIIENKLHYLLTF